jgi:hypothetical protein
VHAKQVVTNKDLASNVPTSTDANDWYETCRCLDCATHIHRHALDNDGHSASTHKSFSVSHNPEC